MSHSTLVDSWYYYYVVTLFLVTITLQWSPPLPSFSIPSLLINLPTNCFCTAPFFYFCFYLPIQNPVESWKCYYFVIWKILHWEFLWKQTNKQTNKPISAENFSQICVTIMWWERLCKCLEFQWEKRLGLNFAWERRSWYQHPIRHWPENLPIMHIILHVWVCKELMLEL